MLCSGRCSTVVTVGDRPGCAALPASKAACKGTPSFDARARTTYVKICGPNLLAGLEPSSVAPRATCHANALTPVAEMRSASIPGSDPLPLCRYHLRQTARSTRGQHLAALCFIPSHPPARLHRSDRHPLPPSCIPAPVPRPASHLPSGSYRSSTLPCPAVHRHVAHSTLQHPTPREPSSCLPGRPRPLFVHLRE